jgi:hypothetical protein
MATVKAGRWVAKLGGDLLKLIYSGDPSTVNEQHKKVAITSLLLKNTFKIQWSSRVRGSAHGL